MRERVLQADRPTLPALVDELQFHLRSIALDAFHGDEDSRRWLVSAFPGHDRIFEQVWSRQHNLKKPETAENCLDFVEDC